MNSSVITGCRRTSQSDSDRVGTLLALMLKDRLQIADQIADCSTHLTEVPNSANRRPDDFPYSYSIIDYRSLMPFRTQPSISITGTLTSNQSHLAGIQWCGRYGHRLRSFLTLSNPPLNSLFLAIFHRSLPWRARTNRLLNLCLLR